MVAVASLMRVAAKAQFLFRFNDPDGQPIRRASGGLEISSGPSGCVAELGLKALTIQVSSLSIKWSILKQSIRCGHVDNLLLDRAKC
jgi:hypothetical protein